MFISDLNCWWLENPFFTNQLKVGNEKIIKKILRQGINRLLKKQPVKQSMNGLPKLCRLKAKQFKRFGRINFGQATAEKVPDGLFQQPVREVSIDTKKGLDIDYIWSFLKCLLKLSPNCHKTLRLCYPLLQLLLT